MLSSNCFKFEYDDFVITMTQYKKYFLCIIKKNVYLNTKYIFKYIKYEKKYLLYI